jgi:signal transduction histidine kinase
MKLLDYCKDKIVSIFIFFLLLIIVISLLLIFNVNLFLIVYISLFISFSYIGVFLYEFFRRREYYNTLLNNLENLDQKYLVNEMLMKPNFLEGKIFFESMQDINKSMVENVNKYLYKQEEFREYIEMWIHEIKTPIASSKLISQNNLNEVTKSIDEEIDKIDSYIEQVLYYSRSDNVYKDYIIKEILLDQVVNNVILKNKKYFITKKIKLNLENLELKINSDSKWLEYILNQVITNSIKYSNKENSSISIYAKEYLERIDLFIEDNGIGIERKDLSRVFEKGFTGENGRKIYNSTGMGLYLCKKLCDKLDHSIDVKSTLGEGTIVRITFPIGTFSKIK